MSDLINHINYVCMCAPLSLSPEFLKFHNRINRGGCDCMCVYWHPMNFIECTRSLHLLRSAYISNSFDFVGDIWLTKSFSNNMRTKKHAHKQYKIKTQILLLVCQYTHICIIFCSLNPKLSLPRPLSSSSYVMYVLCVHNSIIQTHLLPTYTKINPETSTNRNFSSLFIVNAMHMLDGWLKLSWFSQICFKW